MDGLVEHGLESLAGAFGQALAGDEEFRLAADRRQSRAAPWPSSVGWPSTQWSAAKWPHLASMCKAPDDRPVPVTTTTSGSSGVRRRMSAQVCSRAAMRPQRCWPPSRDCGPCHARPLLTTRLLTTPPRHPVLDTLDGDERARSWCRLRCDLPPRRPGMLRSADRRLGDAPGHGCIGSDRVRAARLAALALLPPRGPPSPASASHPT